MTGECFCGSIKYRIGDRFSKIRACHCSRCRKAFSGSGSAVGWLEPGDHSWTEGEAALQTYVDRRGVGIGFCRSCGTTLCGIFDGAVLCVTLGTLDEDPTLSIEEHIFVGSKAKWDQIGGTAPQYFEGPDSARVEG
jgi:hypothetical protein